MNINNQTYHTFITPMNLDEARKKDIENGRGFIIDSPQKLNSDIKNENGIFSSKYNADIHEKNAFMNRYKCECGKLNGTLNYGQVCPECGTKVKQIDDDFKIFGWIVFNDYYVIHPSLYMNIESLIGSKNLNKIIRYKYGADEDGFEIKKDEKPVEFEGIGYIEFINRIDEIIEYFGRKNKQKRKHYYHLKRYRSMLLTHSIPVYTLFLRLVHVQGKMLSFKGDNGLYNSLSRYASLINNIKDSLGDQYKIKEKILYESQLIINELKDSLLKSLNGKYGVIRNLLGGRYNFSSRAVIIPDKNLRIDEIILPYYMLVVLNEQIIINILTKSFTMTYSEAYKKWWKSQLNIDKDVLNIINYIIKYHKRGDPYIINRNPSINLGSILHMYCVGVETEGFVMHMPLQILATLGADFDGDALNILKFINKEFEERCSIAFNPRNSLMISHNDGTFDNTMNIFKDELINLNSFMYLGRDSYTEEDINKIDSIEGRI